MLIIKYEKSGKVFSDFGLIENIDNFLKFYNYDFKENNIEISIASENFINAVRLFVVRRKIDNKFILFKYKDEEITIDEDGAYNDFVEGFADCTQSLLKAIVESNFEIYGKQCMTI